MFISANEWSTPPLADQPPVPAGTIAGLYRDLMDKPDENTCRNTAAVFLDQQIALADGAPCDLPDSPQELDAWMQAGALRATSSYSLYLDERKAGAPRRYFSNRAHALYFMRAVAPTKLVDGAWLYGLLKHWPNPRFSDLVQIYVEELGEGAPDKNHVLLYRGLLARYGLDPVEQLDDALYAQGAMQLALARNAESYLPEVIGFNLGYEQLPLHLLITAYELNELGLDPYYFTLHVTVDNLATGHARRAVQAVLDNIPRLGDASDFWRRVRLGYQLSNAGLGSTAVIGGFDIEQEVVRIFSQKSMAGHGTHSDYCRVAGRHVNEWLARPSDIPEFLAALKKAGWIKQGAPVEDSRFWSLLQGTRAEMFGVFSPYELQVIHDWIRAEASYDGRAYTETTGCAESARRSGFRVVARLAATRGESALGATPGEGEGELLDSDLQALNQQLSTLDDAGQASLLVQAMAPSQHWTPAGLHATHLFSKRMGRL